LLPSACLLIFLCFRFSGVDKMGFQGPTRIQAQAIPVAMSGQHLLVKAATGTGKTLAYLAPIVHLLQMREPRVERTHGAFGNGSLRSALIPFFAAYTWICSVYHGIFLVIK
uniref:DEAD/DEAH-box helicase domain-containing protein n=1 Tax=Aegilops tauschii subsp. strangulata TaxID=200361 RepID=A0A452XMF6_AEGTS